MFASQRHVVTAINDLQKIRISTIPKLGTRLRCSPISINLGCSWSLFRQRRKMLEEMELFRPTKTLFLPSPSLQLAYLSISHLRPVKKDISSQSNFLNEKGGRSDRQSCNFFALLEIPPRLREMSSHVLSENCFKIPLWKGFSEFEPKCSSQEQTSNYNVGNVMQVALDGGRMQCPSPHSSPISSARSFKLVIGCETSLKSVNTFGPMDGGQ